MWWHDEVVMPRKFQKLTIAWLIMQSVFSALFNHLNSVFVRSNVVLTYGSTSTTAALRVIYALNL
jgi:hypothetical protein